MMGVSAVGVSVPASVCDPPSSLSAGTIIAPQPAANTLIHVVRSTRTQVDFAFMTFLIAISAIHSPNDLPVAPLAQRGPSPLAHPRFVRGSACARGSVTTDVP